MTKPTGDMVNMQSHLRFFYQVGGACPINPMLYGGMDGQFLNIESGTNPIRGIDPTYVQDPKSAGRFMAIARQKSAPDLPSGSVQFLQKRGELPAQLWKLRLQPTTFYQLVGNTADLSDFASGWDSYVKIYAGGEATDGNEGAGAWDGGEQIQDELDYTFDSIYAVAPITFDEKGSSEVFSEVKGVVWGSHEYGLSMAYSVTDNTVGSSGEPPSIYYHKKNPLNGTWSSVQAYITGAASTDVPQAIAIVGDKLVIVFDDGAAGGYFYATLNSKTGIPSAFTKIATGFVSGGAPLDVYAVASRSIWFCGEGGYIYKSQNIQSGVSVVDAGTVTSQDLNRISGHSNGQTLVIGGDSDVVLYSTDAGNSFSTAAAPGNADNVTAVAALSGDLWWIGDDGGAVWYTTDQGNTWNDAGFPSTVATVQDIVFPTPEVGFVLTATSAPAGTIHTTYNGGVDWVSGTPRLVNTPTVDRFNRIAFPQTPELSANVNHLIVGGLAGDGADGVVFIGTPVSFS